MLGEGIRLVKLTSAYTFKSFDCEDHDLNDFFLNDSKPALDEFLAVTYIFENDEDTIGFFCVSNDRISSEDAPNPSKWKKVRKQIPHTKSRSSYPAAKIGRLAISKKYQNSGFGSKILNYIKYLFVSSNKTGCRFLLVDAYKTAEKFYLNNGFIELPIENNKKSTILMYFDLGYLKDLREE